MARRRCARRRSDGRSTSGALPDLGRSAGPGVARSRGSVRTPGPGARRRRRRLRPRPLPRQHHRQRLPENVQGSGQNDVATVLGPVPRRGRDGSPGPGCSTIRSPSSSAASPPPAPSRRAGPATSASTPDHKVVGLQYPFGVLLFFFTGGLFAMAIRTELLSPTNHLFGPGTYIAVVSEHGTIMMMMASSVVVGPLGNWLVPLMIGSRRMAFPRVEAFSSLDLRRRLPRHPDRPSARWLPDGVDRLRAAADPGRRREWTRISSGSP